MSYSQSEIVFVGGELNKSNYSTVGHIAATVLQQLNIDLAFISTSSWNKKGLSTPDIKKVTVKKAVIASSMTHVLVTDSSKYGQRAAFHIVELQKFKTIITDSHFSQMTAETLKKELGITVLKAEA